MAGTFMKHVRVLVQPSFVAGSPHGTTYSDEESPFTQANQVVGFHEDLDLIQFYVYV